MPGFVVFPIEPVRRKCHRNLFADHTRSQHGIQSAHKTGLRFDLSMVHNPHIPEPIQHARTKQPAGTYRKDYVPFFSARQLELLAGSGSRSCAAGAGPSRRAQSNYANWGGVGGWVQGGGL